jgi:sec-independent protein translocase protein TatB
VGFSLGEIFLLILVGIIVVGPKRLPGMMRTAGQWVGRLRRMSSDLRSQSGIDDLLRQEGLDKHLHELRSLSRMNMVESLMTPAAASPLAPPAARLDQAGRGAGAGGNESRPRPWAPAEPLREREYPLTGCDARGALADDAPVYDGGSAPKPPTRTETPAAEQAPAADAPVEQAPAADAPVEQAPAADAPVAQAPEVQS